MAREFKTPASNDYLLAIGRAFYNFANLEHHIKHIIIKLTSQDEIPEKATAGAIHKIVLRLVTELPASSLKTELEELITEFDAQVKVRNSLLHATPYTADGGAQQVGYNYIEWTMDDIYDAAFNFEELAGKLNDLYHNRLP